MSTTIDLRDEITPWLDGQLASFSDTAALNRAAAEGALPVFQQHFRGLSASNVNPFGARGGFWGRMLAGTRADATAQAGFIHMPREVALRYFGGTVFPKTKKLLAIPARTEAYGKSPRQFDSLQFVRFRSGAMALVQKADTHVALQRGKNKGRVRLAKEGESATHGAGAVMYWLKPSVTVRGDQGVLPTVDEIRRGAIGGLATYANVTQRRNASVARRTN